MSEASESREYVAQWLKQVPDFMEEIGIADTPDLAARLQYLGSGRGADVIYLGERDGVKLALKITMESAQGLMSQAALEDEPEGVVPVYEVVETDIAPRTLLPSLPKKGQKPVYVRKTWGILQKFAVPVDTLYMLGATSVAGEAPDTLTKRFNATREAYQNRMKPDDPDVRRWLRSYVRALQWLETVCEDIGSQYDPDLHVGNWGIDPETGDLVLLDLGQCYEIEVNANPNLSPTQREWLKSEVLQVLSTKRWLRTRTLVARVRKRWDWATDDDVYSVMNDLEDEEAILGRSAKESDGTLTQEWRKALASNPEPEKEPHAVYYKGGARAKKKIERIFESLNLQPDRHFTRQEEIEGETDPHYRKHARAKFFIELTHDESRALEQALEDSGVDWSFYF